MTEIQKREYDYSGLEAESRAGLIRCENEIEEILHMSAFRMGKVLLKAKEHLPHGEWGKWLKLRWGWSERTAQNMMNVSRSFKDPESAGLFSRSVQNYLAAPSISDEIRNELISRAEAGEKITLDNAKLFASLKECAENARRMIARTQENMKMVSRTLAEMRDLLGVEEFGKWVSAVYEISVDEAQEIIDWPVDSDLDKMLDLFDRVGFKMAGIETEI